MDMKKFTSPFLVKDIRVEDKFWKERIELARNEVIPYQWAALNDEIPEAAPSFCMHNFKAAVKLNNEKTAKGTAFKEPVFTPRGVEALPEDLRNPDDNFYGFVFQDSDFYKWIEAVGYLLAIHPDAELEKTADAAIDIVCEAQQEDGYLDTFYILNGKDKIFTNLRDFHELYCLGHLCEGAVAYYQGTGKRKLLDAACKFADYVGDYFGPEEGKCKGYPGHELAELALVRLYEVTGEEKYLNLSKFFIDERGKRPYYFDKEHPQDIKNDIDDLRYQYHQAHLPVREQDEAVGHSVRAVYLYAGMADVARLTNDEELFKACEILWHLVTDKKYYITGGIGSTHIGEAFSYNYDLPNDTAYAETCASIGLVFWARRMLEISPNSKYADVMERALYNGILSGMDLDGKAFFYVNPLEVNPEACHEDERIAHVKSVRQKWFGCACCPPNLARMLTSVGTYAYTESENSLFVHLYMAGAVKMNVDGNDINIKVSSNFPWSGEVKIDVSEVNSELTLALRIPAWSKGYTIDAPDAYVGEVKDGYLYLKGDWTSVSNFAISFKMETQIIQTNPLVRDNVGKVAILRGPIVYCAEEVDNGKNLHNLYVDITKPIREDKTLIDNEEVISLTLSGYRQMPIDGSGLYYEVRDDVREEVSLKLVPYYAWCNRGENEMMVWLRKA
ncbi:MAG: glycoside hydrolase family 127 protein [Oscillospiraceae bacterium]|nr:glycoside hydrolase family 127 protein [Oscillospiraceae bacterium]